MKTSMRLTTPLCALLAAAFLLLPRPTRAQNIPEAASIPRIEVVFVLDSTGSMSGLIEGAKQKIWSIANTIISRKPTPEVRIGLLTYRDRGDDYITKMFDLSDDIDTVFKNLRSFAAGGGGDGPESVNQALDEAVHKMSWSMDKDIYKTSFLVGDYPPHMDYKDDVKYPVTCEEAVRKDLVINTVQCGNFAGTTPIWQEIARRSEGEYVAPAQSGNMTVIETPYDKDIAKLSGDLGRTSLAYGPAKQKADVGEKLATATGAAPTVAADRVFYNLSTGGRAVQGRGDLLTDVKDGAVKLEDVNGDELPAELQKLSKEERAKYVAEKQKERDKLNAKLTGLARQRQEYIDKENKRLAAAGKGDAFDQKVVEIINAQADRKR